MATATEKVAKRCFLTICSILSKSPPIHCLVRCLRCRGLGVGIKLYMIGITHKEITYKHMILIEETIPNSFRILLSVMIKVAKPAAVVRFVSNGAMSVRARARATAPPPPARPVARPAADR